MSDQDIINTAIAEWQAGHPISDGQARVIAAGWHGGQASPLYSFASTGAIRPSVLSEVERERDHAAGTEYTEELDALLGYLQRVGNREPVRGWSAVWG